MYDIWRTIFGVRFLKILYIKIKKTSNVIQTGTDGIERQISQTYNHKLKVKTIDMGLRFVHLIVDYFVVMIIFYIINSIPAINETILQLLGLLTFLAYPLLYIFTEYKFQQTPGKMATGYMVINKYAEKPDLQSCVLRTLIRFVPFEAFSCLSSPSRGWHDKWTSTYVVSKDEAMRKAAHPDQL